MHIFIRMRKKFVQEIVIPEGVEVKREEDTVFVKGPEGESSKEFNFGKLSFEIKDSKIILSHLLATKKEKRMINTISSHLKNLVEGAQKKFEYKLKICSSHFLMSVEQKDQEIVIKNFLGEKTPRKCKIPKGAEIEINKEIITVKSTNKEIAGQAAANFEATTKIRNKDRRVFQDGIFIIDKNGREI